MPPASLLGLSAKMEAARRGEIRGSQFCAGEVKGSASKRGSEERREKKVKRKEGRETRRREARECYPSEGSSNFLLKARSSASLKLFQAEYRRALGVFT